MPARRRIDHTAGQAAVRHWTEGDHDRTTMATAVRYLLEELAARAPGQALEVRIPPFGATQCIEGPRHTRGTPPAVVEMDAETWLALATGRLPWADAVGSGAVDASGDRANLSTWLPLTASETS